VHHRRSAPSTVLRVGGVTGNSIDGVDGGPRVADD